MADVDPRVLASGASARGRAAAQSLIDVHDELRAESAQVRGLLAQLAEGDLDVAAARGELQRLALRRHDWTTGAYCSAHCLAVAQHHFGEDREIFPILRRARPSLAPVLQRLEAEHVSIHGLLEQVDAALVALVAFADDDEGGRTRLREVVELFEDALAAHLAFEEQELLVPMAQVFG